MKTKEELLEIKLKMAVEALDKITNDREGKYRNVTPSYIAHCALYNISEVK